VNTPINGCITIPGEGPDAILCQDGSPPDSYETIVLANPGAELQNQDWAAQFGGLEFYSGEGLQNCILPTPPQGDNAWILGEVCEQSGVPQQLYQAEAPAPLSQESKAIILSGNGQVRLTAQAGTDYSVIEILAYIALTDQSGQETTYTGTQSQEGPTVVPWNVIRAVTPVEENLSSMKVGVKFQGEAWPIGGWFDDVHVEVLNCP